MFRIDRSTNKITKLKEVRFSDLGFRVCRRLLTLALTMVALTAVAAAELDERKPIVTRRVQPIYPQELFKARVNGSAAVQFVVQTDGTVSDATAFYASRPEFGQAAVASIRQWQFSPGIKEGRPVVVRMKQSMYFSIEPTAEEMASAVVVIHPPVAIRKGDVPPKLIEQEEPNYPQQLILNHAGGSVTATYWVTPEGSVENVEISKATEKSLEFAVRFGIAETRYEPPTRDGRAVRMKLRQVFDFSYIPREVRPSRFTDAGFPAPDRVWFPRDYALTARIIQDGTPELPTLKDPDGAELFQRMVRLEHLTALEKPEVPIGVQLQRHATLVIGVRNILTAYVKAATDRNLDLHAEVAQLVAFTLGAVVIGLGRTQDLAQRIPGSAERPTYLDQLREMKVSVTKVFGTVETSLSDPFFSAEDRSLFLRVMADVMPDALAAFAGTELARIRQKFQRRIAEFPDPADQSALQALIAAIDHAASTTSNGSPSE